MTHRDRYAEPLDEWAEPHAEPDDRPAPAATITETCRYHGDWQMVPLDINAECPQCADLHARRDAEHNLRTSAAWDHQRENQ